MSKPEATIHRPAFRREDRHEVRQILSVWCAIILSWVFWLTPRFARYWFADRISDLTYAISHTYVLNVRENLKQASREPMEPGALDRMVREIEIGRASCRERV